MLLQTGVCALNTLMPDPWLRYVTPWSSHGLVVGLFPEIHLVITGEPEGKLRSQKVAGSSTTSLQKSLLARSLGTRYYHLQRKALPLVCELGTGGILWFRRGSKKSMEDKLLHWGGDFRLYLWIKPLRGWWGHPCNPKSPWIQSGSAFIILVICT